MNIKHAQSTNDAIDALAQCHAVGARRPPPADTFARRLGFFYRNPALPRRTRIHNGDDGMLWKRGRVTGPKGHQSEGSLVRKIAVNCVEQQVWNTGHITRDTSILEQ